jgi:L-ascorbate metabolism protein UlaG (beta-lactamase superfamily)
MKITKFVQSCLLVEMPDRTALFDPGTMSPVPVESLQYLDDIFITHNHGDHMDVELIKKLVARFPDVRITAPAEVVEQLSEDGIKASADAPEGAAFFDSPHEVIRPFMQVDPPQEIGVHYLDTLSHPGDSHSFHESKVILALPVQAPWGSTVEAVRLALELKPKYIIPIHDWHWSDAARESTYDRMEARFAEHDIVFIKAKNGEPFTLDV